MQAGEGRFSNQ